MARWSHPVPVEGRERTGPRGGALPDPRKGEIIPPGAARRSLLWYLLVGIPGWAVVGFVFWEALKQPSQLIFSLLLWIGCLLLIGLATFAWSRYVRGARVVARKRRASGRDEPAPYRALFQATDALGKEIEVDPAARTARVVTVRLEGETKSLKVGD